MVKLSTRELFSSTNIFLLLILIAGFIVRLWGIGYYLPYYPWPEEVHWCGFHFYFLQTGDWNAHFAHKPTFLMYMLSFVFAALFAFRPELRLLEFCTPLFILIGRIFCASMGALTIFLLFVLGKVVFSKKVGLISALFLCFSFLHVFKSHRLHVDVPMTFFVVLSFIFIYKGYLYGKIKDFVFAGIFAGLATSTKYPAVVLFFPIFLGNFFYVINKKNRKKEIFFGKRLILSIISMVVSFIVSSPFIVIDYLTTKQHLFSEFTQMARCGRNSLSFYLTNVLPEGMGLTLFLFSLGSLVYILYRRKQGGILLIAFPLTLFIILSMSVKRAARYAVPLMPFLCLFAGYFFIEIIDRLNFKSKIWRIIIGFILGIFLIGESATRAVYLDWMFTREDTRVQAKKWIEENIPPSAVIDVRCGFAQLTLGRVDGQLPVVKKLQKVSNWRQMKKQFYEHYIAYNSKRAKRKYDVRINYFRKGFCADRSTCPDYVVLYGKNISESSRYSAPYQSIIDSLQLLRTFSPYRNIGEDDLLPSGKSIFRRTCFGPLVKIYRINK